MVNSNAQHKQPSPFSEKNRDISSTKQEAQRAIYRAPEYNVPPFW